MRKLSIFALLIALSVCFANACKNTIYDTVIVHQAVIDTIHRLNYDSLTVDNLLEKSQKFYADSFNNLMMLFTIIIALIGLPGIFFSIRAKKDADEVKKEIDKINEKIKDTDRIKEEINKIKEKIEKDKKYLEKNRIEIFGEIGYFYFSLAITAFNAKKYKEHFIKLAEHYYIFANYNIEPRDIDLIRLACFDDFIKEYNEKNINLAKIFLYDLRKFIKYCEKNKIESKYVEKIKEIWEKSCVKFGGENKVLKAIENYTYNFKDR